MYFVIIFFFSMIALLEDFGIPLTYLLGFLGLSSVLSLVPGEISLRLARNGMCLSVLQAETPLPTDNL